MEFRVIGWIGDEFLAATHVKPEELREVQELFFNAGAESLHVSLMPQAAELPATPHARVERAEEPAPRVWGPEGYVPSRRPTVPMIGEDIGPGPLSAVDLKRIWDDVKIDVLRRRGGTCAPCRRPVPIVRAERVTH